MSSPDMSSPMNSVFECSKHNNYMSVITIFTARQQSCGKGIFSLVSDTLSRGSGRGGLGVVRGGEYLLYQVLFGGGFIWRVYPVGVYAGGGYVQGWVCPGVRPEGDGYVQGVVVSTPQNGTSQGMNTQLYPLHPPLPFPPQLPNPHPLVVDMVKQAGGTYPTGMLSCKCFVSQAINSQRLIINTCCKLITTLAIIIFKCALWTF